MGTTPPITTNNPQNTRPTKPDQAKFTPLEVQCFQTLLNFHSNELHATFWKQVTADTTSSPRTPSNRQALERSPHRRSLLIARVHNTGCPRLVHSHASTTPRQHCHHTTCPGLVVMAATTPPARQRIRQQQTSPEREARGTFVFVRDEEITCPHRSPCE